MLQLTSDLEPMEAVSVSEIPAGKEWRYEPKWDGFRCVVFKDGARIELKSKSGQSLGRYFPEVVDAISKLKARTFVLDGEIVVPVNNSFSFDDLLQRIHPAESRVKKLALEHPATLIVFDLLAGPDGKSLVDLPLEKRRPRLEALAAKHFKDHPRFFLSPSTHDLGVMKKWFEDVGGSLDGIIAKRSDLPYRAGSRSGMVKVKAIRTADCVVGGFRYAEKGREVGSLLLGLYDDKGLLNHVGFTSGFKGQDKKALTAKLEKAIRPPGFTGKKPGGPSRWSTRRSSEWEPLAPKFVVEIGFDHFTGGRFRHGTKLIRWRPDKAPRQCTMDQIHQKAAAKLFKIA
jgi:ATP-dependent DNA ligase